MADLLFRRITKVDIGPLKFNSDDLEIRFTVPFDDDSKPNVSSLQIYNLTDDTIIKIRKGLDVSLNAGYKDDHGLIVEGKVTSVVTKYEEVDKITTIKIKEGKDYSGTKVDETTADAPKKYFVKKRVKLKKPIVTKTVAANGRKYTKTTKYKTIQEAKWRKQTMVITFSKNTKASTIIKRLAGILGIKFAELNLPKDKVYKKGFKVTGKIETKLNAVVKDCDAVMYWRRGKMVIRSIEIGDDERFILKSSTGLIGTPEQYEDDDYKGYTVRCLLQHRITTASIIDLESKTANGKYRVRKGQHYYDGSDFVTEFEVIE